MVNKVTTINKLFLDLFQIDQETITDDISADSDQSLSIQEFNSSLIRRGKTTGLLYLSHELFKEELLELVAGEVPFLTFLQKEGGFQAVVLRKLGKQIYLYEKDIDNPVTIEQEHLENILLKNNEGKFYATTCIPASHVGADQNEILESPVKSFLRLLSTEKKEILYIYLYAIIGGIISLSLPLGIQSIINFISSGQISTSVIVLIGFIIIGLLISGGMQIMQLSIVELIQQRLFAKIAFNIANRIPRVKVESILKYYPPELINRFFDIITVQKGISSILIDLTSAVLQILFGLILLSLYHPYFIFFGIVLIGILYLIIYLTGPQGLETSNKESKYKYQLAWWLEEVARTLNTFKLSGDSNLPLEKTDRHIAQYLKARKKHFKVLVKQYLSFVGFKTIVTAGLLILGTVLIINKEINIGQFVASEIIIILIMSAVEKVILKLEKVYDILTSTSKLQQITTLPIERPTGYDLTCSSIKKGLSIKVQNLKYKYPDSNTYALNGINLEVAAGERICITGLNGSGKTTLINVLLGLLENYEGSIIFNGLSLRNINKSNFHKHIGNNLSEEEIFHATLLENLTLGRKEITMDKIIWALEFVGLDQFVATLPEGLDTNIIGGNLRLPKNIIYKIILARSIMNSPKLLILDDFLMGIEKREKFHLLNLLMDRKNDWTIIIISTDADVMELCDRTILIQGGKNVFQGKFEPEKQEEIFAELV
jgi:ABC-type bacteriocin/lantibiotic exporter with double-glycine peptidase domain